MDEKEKLRKTGIELIGDAPWGTHFCQFYHAGEDLIDILVPYFKAGLENNEFCMWITSEPLEVEDAKTALREAVDDLDSYIKKGQIEIIPYTEWYLKDGVFDLQRVFDAWIDKLDQALSKGYDGMRVTGNTAWLETKDWKGFADYEEELNSKIREYRIIAICSYSLDKCGANEIIDVVSNHQFALINQAGQWKTIHSAEHEKAEETTKRGELLINEMGRIAKIGAWEFDVSTQEQVWTEEVYRIHEVDMTYKPTVKMGIEFYAPSSRPIIEEAVKRAIDYGEPFDLELELITAKGNHLWVHAIGKATQENGKTTEVSGIFQDITERKKKEEDIKKKVHGLEVFHEAAVDRELKMKKLEARIKELEAQLGEKA
jgi:PAS domain-containing protein